MLIAENDDVVTEHDQQIANLFPVALAVGAALITIYARVAPESKKGMFAEFL